MLKPGGRLIAVGDPYQAIFGFTGADNDSLDQIRRAFNAITLPLNASFPVPAGGRGSCPEVGEPHRAGGDGSGREVRTIKYAELVEASEKALDGRDAILCRKTAPLLELAFSLIRRGVGCRVEGRDIGTQLVNLIRKYKVKSSLTSAGGLTTTPHGRFRKHWRRVGTPRRADRGTGWKRCGC
jgi:DNA helicase-2/ATP-dependent DNA helicase PcrA